MNTLPVGSILIDYHVYACELTKIYINGKEYKNNKIDLYKLAVLLPKDQKIAYVESFLK